MRRKNVQKGDIVLQPWRDNIMKGRSGDVLQWAFPNQMSRRQSLQAAENREAGTQLRKLRSKGSRRTKKPNNEARRRDAQALQDSIERHIFHRVPQTPRQGMRGITSLQFPGAKGTFSR